MPASYGLTVSVSRASFEHLQSLANEAGVSMARMASMIIEQHRQAAAPRNPAAKRQIEAEQALCRWARATADEFGREFERAGWDKHVTRKVFERIEREKLALYEAATNGTDRRRINRLIGSIVKDQLGAKAETGTDGRPRMGEPRRSETTLIKAYTYLVPPNEENADAPPKS